jgi:hypothetical protein
LAKVIKMSSKALVNFINHIPSMNLKIEGK